VIENPDQLIADFRDAASRAGIVGWPCTVRTDVRRAPHTQPTLPAGFAAVYVFALSREAGKKAPARAGAVLKVGRVGPNSGARFTSQHYSPGSARSSLARSLIRHRVMWPWLGVESIDEANVRTWMTENLDRFHFFVATGHDEVLAELEVYVRARGFGIRRCCLTRLPLNALFCRDPSVRTCR
jgi:hypothetical protein